MAERDLSDLDSHFQFGAGHVGPVDGVAGRSLKILFFIHGMAAGGAERQASLLCNHWAEAGREVVLATLREEPSHYDLHHAIVRRTIRTGQSSSSALKRQWIDLQNIRQLIAQERPHVVAVFLDAMNIKVLFAARKSGVPIVISERSVPESSFLYGRLMGTAVVSLRRLLYPISSALVVQTEPVAQWARSARLSRRIAVIPNVVELNHSISQVQPPRAKMVLSVGRLSREKGHDVLIRAFAQVAERFSDWRLKIIGDGISRQQLSGLIGSLGMQNRIELAPIQKSVVGEYRSAGVFVLPSRFEGFPNALIEAMQTGCAVVSADCPVGPREIISHGTDGLLFRNEDASHLASQLTMLMQDGELRRSLGERARETVRKYEPEVILPMWDSLLDDVIKQRQM